jgi:outer membrane murein-binding lipoprotein Lpp
MKATKERIMLGAVALLAMLLPSCVSVKGYQKMYINDSEMELSTRKVQLLEQNVLMYREGASGANGGKTGGGCGCN